jgi:predicted DNA-binding transcriptional regulator AlpA
MLKRLLDVDEAIVYLRERGVKITKQSLYTQICRLKKPRALKIGRSLRFTTEDLDEYVRSITRER